MPRLRTDDGPRKLRAVWLGPKGATLPFEWTYVQWTVTIVAVPTAATVAAAAAWLLGAPGWVLVLAVLYGAATGVYLAVKAMRNVTFDEPLRHKTATVRAELGRRGRRAGRPATAWTWAEVPIADLTDPAATVLIPRKDSPDA